MHIKSISKKRGYVFIESLIVFLFVLAIVNLSIKIIYNNYIKSQNFKTYRDLYTLEVEEERVLEVINTLAEDNKLDQKELLQKVSKKKSEDYPELKSLKFEYKDGSYYLTRQKENSVMYIELKKNYYKGQEYDNYNINLLLEKLGNKRRLLILSQSIFIKKYEILNKRISVDKFIEKKISEDFSDKKNLLFHYEFLKNSKIIYIYSIRYNSFIKSCTNITHIQVEPIQFLIRKYVIKKVRGGKYSIIIYRIKDLFHLINIENGVIENSYITNDATDINKFIIEYKNQNKKLIIDKGIEDITINNYDYIINIGEKVYEEIFKK